MVITVRVPPMDQIVLLKNYSYLIRVFVLAYGLDYANVDTNVWWMWFPNLWA